MTKDKDMKSCSQSMMAVLALSSCLAGLATLPQSVQAGTYYYHYRNMHVIDGRRYVHHYTVVHRTAGYDGRVRHYYHHYHYHYRTHGYR